MGCAGPSEAPARRRWPITGFLALAAGINYADRSAFAAILPAVKIDLHLTDAALGVAGSIFLWAYAAASPLAGALADRWPRLWLALGSLAVWSGITALTGSIRGLVSLLACRAGLGLAESAYHPAAFALVADVHPPRSRARAMSLLSAGFQLGVVGGGTAAGWFADRGHWRGGLAAFGAIGFVAAAAGIRLIPPLTSSSAANSGGIPTLGFLSRCNDLFRRPLVHVLLWKSLFTGVTTWMFFAWLPFYLHESYGLALATSGFLGSISLQLTKTIGLAIGGWHSDRRARRAGPVARLATMAGYFLAAAPFAVVFAFRPNLVTVTASLMLFAGFTGMAMAGEQPALCEAVPGSLRSLAIGCGNTFSMAGGGLGVLLAGVCKRTLGLPAIFALSAGTYVVAAALLLAYRWTSQGTAGLSTDIPSV